jgi:hypothetical protein
MESTYSPASMSSRSSYPIKLRIETLLAAIMHPFITSSSLIWTLAAVLPGYGTAAAAFSNSSCSPSTFTFPKIFGAELVELAANEVRNFSQTSLLPGTDVPFPGSVDYCNLTVTYTHPGWDDRINVFIYIPFEDWNGRLLGIGGGGFSASMGPLYQIAGVGEKFVAISTDSGHSSGKVAATDPSSWTTHVPGNLNLELIEDWASRTLGELSTIGKQATRDYFDVDASHSYFTGCSGGGRQGFELAQSFPDAFDGILAAAPAIYIETLLTAGYWPRLLMEHLGEFPSRCEIEAFTKAAVNKCDSFDGLEDGIISHPASCKFNAHDIVGQRFNCDGEQKQLTEAGAKVVQAAWNGFNSSEISWPGLEVGADLTEAAIVTGCEKGEVCASASLFEAFLANLVVADPDFDPSGLSTEEFSHLLVKSVKMFRSQMGSANPALHRFQKSGGKMISWHGLADTTVPPKASRDYYNNVLKQNANVSDYFRHFEAPGVGHCSGGLGPIPNTALGQLIAWVENGTAPEVLDAASVTSGLARPLCQYPESEQVYLGGNATSAAAFACVPKV